jgi:hypothetical protein
MQAPMMHSIERDGRLGGISSGWSTPCHPQDSGTHRPGARRRRTKVSHAGIHRGDSARDKHVHIEAGIRTLEDWRRSDLRAPRPYS